MRQIRELMAHRQKSPWGWRRVTTGEALIWAMIGNAHRGKNTAPFKPQDVLPKQKQSRAERQRQLVNTCDMIFAMARASDEAKKAKGR